MEIVETFKNLPDRCVLNCNKEFDLVLFRWPAGKFLDFHYHQIGGCIFKVLLGSLLEFRQDQIQVLNSGQVHGIINQQGPHAIYALQDTISLHIYIKDRIDDVD